MKILIVGMGSIGQRHARLIRSVMGEGAELWCLRKRGPELLINPPEAVECDSVARHYGMREFPDLDAALAQRPTAVFVCNPTSLHLQTAIRCAQSGAHLFIEKPVGCSAEEFRLLRRTAEENGVAVCVGYQTRFDPMVEKVAALLSEPGNEVVSCRMRWMTYLPAHHPYEDYRLGYAAREDLGGGVIFCLSHELDLISRFFGLPQSVYALQGEAHSLDMPVDTSVSALFSCAAPSGSFPLHLQLSFAQGDEERGFSVETASSVIRCDLVKRRLECVAHSGGRREWDFSNVIRDDLFRAQCEHVCRDVLTGGTPRVGLAEAGESLSMALSMHKSLRTGEVEKILPFNE
ncbi:Gfo/Idh/MocA family oxidoreductase [uncultured Pseudodesulfovibrio sp.]|uniref:Gfo/Idh/MocA family protein n=1 Tax=uncultured Pseudodesulfovibrio sp. TaxID=2035858 RepID=UPI0029C85D22|nr:Gfo/Idh/MocA family oxidoreductase [uncultured Pseudodesulfovibrio sp.]